MSWKTGLIAGLGGTVFYVDQDIGDAYLVHGVTVIIAGGQMGQQPHPIIAPYPLELFGFVDGSMRLEKSKVTLTADASESIIRIAEQAWNTEKASVRV